MKLISLVPLKEGSMQARELAKDYSMSQLQQMLDQRLGPDQEAASDMPDFDPNKFSNSEDFGPSANDLDAAITIKRGDSGEMTYGDMLHKNYPDKYGPGGVALDKDTFTKSSKFDRMNEAKIKTKEEFNSNASAEQKAMEKKWDSLVTDIALSKSDNKQFRTNMEAKQEYLEKLNDEGKLKKKYSADKIEGWSTSSSFPGWKVASTVLANKTDENLSEMKSMSADDRTKNMLRTIIHQEVTKLNEADVSQKVKNLTFGIQKSIVSLDPNMPYRVFAKSVAQVLIDDYGTHNYEPFIRELKNALDSTLGDDEVEG
tara:strand:+ start:1059 stop:2000 length:942 start_codon:yes stop_codon:yes gene_type:complete